MHCSPQDVFDVLADGWLYTTWVVGAARIRDVDPDWPRPGTRIHHSVGLWPAMTDDTTHVVACEPPRRLALTARAWPGGEANIEITVEPHDDGCEVSLFEEISSGPGKFVPKILQDIAIGLRNDESLTRLAMLSEGRKRGSGSGGGGSAD